MRPILFHRRALVALLGVLLLAAAACDGPIFKPSSTPSVSLDSDAPGAVGVGDVVTFSLTFAIVGNPANVSMQSVHLDFGDGGSAEAGIVSQDRGIRHAYSYPGTFTATVTATDTLGHEAKARTSVVVAPVIAPTPSVGLFSDATNPSPVGAVVTFTISASIAGSSTGAGAIKTIHMDFGDGQVAELGATAPSGGVTHTYSAAGTYTASVTATTTTGAFGRASVVVVVNGSGKVFTPSVGLTPSTSSVTLGTAISFTVSASIPNAPAGLVIQNIHLDFGDGQSVDLGASPPLGGVAHTYAAVGTYTATATATDTSGKSASASATVTIK